MIEEWKLESVYEGLFDLFPLKKEHFSLSLFISLCFSFLLLYYDDYLYKPFFSMPPIILSKT